jgi:hypothetical protein
VVPEPKAAQLIWQCGRARAEDGNISAEENDRQKFSCSYEFSAIYPLDIFKMV